MKRIKKLISVMLAAVMALAMSITAFAADTKPEHKYEIYQIFTGDYSDGILSNVQWGVNGTGTGKVNTTILEALEALDGKSDTEKLAVIQQYANFDIDPFDSVTMAAGTKDTEISIAVDAPGYYLLRDNQGSLTGDNIGYTLYVVKVVDDTLTFNPKSDNLKDDKKIKVDNELYESNGISMGKVETYEIPATLPSNFGDYKEYYLRFNDTLSKGLTYEENSLQVFARIDGKEVEITDYFGKSVSAYSEETGTTITVAIEDLVCLKTIDGIKAIRGDDGLQAGDEIVLTYQAKLNDKAVIADVGGNPNKVTVDYSNDPNNSGSGKTEPGTPENPPEPVHPTGSTPEEVVNTYTTKLTIHKTNEDGETLTGAEFTLTGEGASVAIVTGEVYIEASDGTYYKLKDGKYTETPPTIAEDETDNSEDYASTEITYKKETTVTVGEGQTTSTEIKGFVDENGNVTFTGLGAGKYVLSESVTPDGFNTMDDIEFEISFNKIDVVTQDYKPEFTVNVTKGDKNIITRTEDNTLSATIKNIGGSLLPSTGGIGTTIFYIVGAILVIGAGIMLVAKKRMSHE